MRHNPTEHPMRVNVNHSRRLRPLLRFLIIRVELPIALQREFQQITVTLSTSAGAMLRGYVACLGWEVDVLSPHGVTITIVAVCEPVRIAGLGLPVREGCFFDGPHGVAFGNLEIAIGVFAGPDL